MYLLDCGTIKDLKFATYTFENNSQGKFMLQIMFGQSKYYSDALSENVKRGNRTKLEKGWRPNQAPLGYLNDPATKTIVRDPTHFPLIRMMFDLMLSGSYTPRQIGMVARDEWGFRTPKKKRIGGQPLAMSSIYKILSNPFYAGVIIWNGHAHPGKHDPVLSIDEFRRVRGLLERPGRPRPQKHRFAFTGMIRCGTCGLRVTAEHKLNRRYGYRYVYYHCTKPSLRARCPEPSIELRSLEYQIEHFLGALAIDPRLESWILEQLAFSEEQRNEEEEARRRSLQKALEDANQQLNELTGLRIRNLLIDDEFVSRRRSLQEERLRIERKLATIAEGVGPIEPFREFTSFSNRAVDLFLRGDEHVKRQILETVASNLTLKSRILNIEAKNPFSVVAKIGTCPRQLGVGDDVRTFRAKTDQMMRAVHHVRRVLDTDEGRDILDNIRKLKQRFEPEVVTKRAQEVVKLARKNPRTDPGI